MKLRANLKNLVLEIICLLYVLLFVYAATSKLLDFQHFKIELGQSPLLSAFAEWFAVLVPSVELLICLLILVPRFRLLGLFGAYALMVMFTVYIFIILHYTSFVPCSCGGVLEKLGWKQHMIFNLVFVGLAILAIMLYFKNNNLTGNLIRIKTRLILFLLITIGSTAIVVLLFLLSENIVHYHNKLTRRFPPSPVLQVAISDLKLNSYYFAGVDSTHIYMGNSTAPLLMTILNNQLMQTEKKMIDLDRKDLPFKGVKISVQSPYFFVADGTVPCIFRGKINNWKAELVHQKGEYFTTALPVDSTSIAVSTNSSITGDNVLGIIEVGKRGKTILNPKILQKQFDGVFDTDGQLLYSAGMQKVIYLYAYRNQFTIADRTLKITGRGATIDTITQAKLSIAKDKKHQQRQFSHPPLFVNKKSAIYKNLLFVNSAIPGRFEDNRMWKEASIIDVYDLVKKNYLLSFCIYNFEGNKMKNFVVQDNHLYALIGNHIIRYKIDIKITSNYIDTNANNLLAK